MQSLLKDQAVRQGIDLRSLLTQAVLYYLMDRHGRRPGWRLPRFKSRESDDRSRQAKLSVTLQEHEWAALAAEADLQGADVDRMLEHAAVYYLADLESGRAATRIVASLEDEMDEPG